ncbi:hypothetical protein [Saccharibacillus endophyticus]|uniref:Uncharacterized protein n=1 Tax=Saccharibacillus endophyticus TaxID=2060666 RepID=A0ABQ1ZRF2_9BACL|nr:hypothetical protein [Saccharibacillus endophyticus]GGH76740.1 hypothetical protein GCM10007362_19440 [Saccharibacillus endophyticus]
MIKQNQSWWKDSEIPDLIGRKKVDPSMLKFGTHIPGDFHSDFRVANKGDLPEVGESHAIKLLYQDGAMNLSFDAELKYIDQHSYNRSSLHLRYDSNKDLQKLFQSIFNFSYNYFLDHMQAKEPGRKNKIIIPDEEAEYISFYMTSISYTYRIILSQHNKNKY